MKPMPKLQRLFLIVALVIVSVPLHVTSALTWWLQGIQARLQTALDNEEATR